MNASPPLSEVSARTSSSQPARILKSSLISTVHPLLLSSVQSQPRLQVPIEPRPNPVEYQENQDSNLQVYEVVEESQSVDRPTSAREVLPTEENASKLPTPNKQHSTSDLMEKPQSPRSCPKCSKQFSSSTSLRIHLANVFPCDQPRPIAQPTNWKLESKTCPKCGKTFASWQGLRGHLNRLKPCNQPKPPSTLARKKDPAKRTCVKCSKVFSSSQSLRIHQNRLKPCDQSTSTPPPVISTFPIRTPTSTPTPTTDSDRKEEERKARARYQSRKAYLKRLGRLHELGDPPAGFSQSGAENCQGEARQELKRSAEDASEGVEDLAVDTQSKRPRQQHNDSVAQQLVGENDCAEPKTPKVGSKSMYPSTTPTSERIVHRSSKNHGGDLLAGGCACPPCVRRWARKLMNRMQHLEGEVLILRRRAAAVNTRSSHFGDRQDDVTHAKEAPGLAKMKPSELMEMEQPRRMSDRPVFNAHSDASGIGTSATVSNPEMESKGSCPVQNQTTNENKHGASRNDARALCGSKTNDAVNGTVDYETTLLTDEKQSMVSSCLEAMKSDQKSLVGAYSDLNDQILMKERALEDSINHVQILMGVDKLTATSFRRQVDELKTSIDIEKGRRDIAAAALIAHDWQSRGDEFKSVLEIASAQKPDEAQAQHARWGELGSQMAEKDTVLSELERRIELFSQPGYSGESGRSRYAELGGLSSKLAAEHASKAALSAERDGVFVELVKSSCRIRLLVRRCLDARQSLA